LNDLPNPFSIEALSPKVEVYKILRAHFIKYFGGLQGEPVERLRAQILLKQNWLNSKLDLLMKMRVEQMPSSLEFRNEVEHAKLKPTKEIVKEVSYLKNNPREKEINPES